MLPLEFGVQSGVTWNLQNEAGDDHEGHQHQVLDGGNAVSGARDDSAAEANEMLAGAAEDFLDPGSWRFGFNIQRTVRF